MDGGPSSSSSTKEEAKDSSMSLSKREKFFSTFITQNFALPDSIMYYIAKNPPSAAMYEKMVKTCKYFFVKNPILVDPDLSFDEKTWKIGRTQLTKITSKLWITRALSSSPIDADQNILSALIPKLYKCDLIYLRLRNQVVSYDDLCLLLTYCEELYLDGVVVKKRDDTIAPLEDLMKAAVNAKSISVVTAAITSKTTKKLLEMPHFSKIDLLYLYNLTELFDIETFYAYMKANKTTTEFWLTFNDSISEAYQTRLEAIVDDILSTENYDFKPPYIRFPGMDDEKEEMLENIFYLNNVLVV